MKKIVHLFVLLLAFQLFSSCAHKKAEHPLPTDYTVAILPLYNATNDVDGPRMVRKIFFRKAQGYFSIKPIDEVDSLLRDRMGVTLGSQLELTTPQKLGEVLGVDGVIYGYLLNFDDVTGGIFNARKVRAGFKLVDTRTGRVLWARGQGVKSVFGVLIGEPVSVFDGLAPFKSIKGIEEIPGINDWYAMINLRSSKAPSTSQEAEAMAALLAATTVLSLGLNVGGKIFEIHLMTESSVMVGRIVEDINKKVISPPGKPQRPGIPKLIFPVYALFGGRDFTSSVTMRTLGPAGEGAPKEIEVSRRGDRLLSKIGAENITTLIKRDDRKGYVIFHNDKKYIEVDLKASNFDTEISREFIGQEEDGDCLCDKYRVRLAYGDGEVREGYVWEVKGREGFVKKAEIDDKWGKTVLEFREVKFTAPPEEEFNLPEGFSKAEE